MTDNTEDIADAVLQLSPPVAVSGITLLGVSLHEWVYIVTIAYTFLGIVTMIKKHWVDPWLEAKKLEKEKNGRKKGS